jgi:hypothetical protein
VIALPARQRIELPLDSIPTSWRIDLDGLHRAHVKHFSDTRVIILPIAGKRTESS